ncbi:ABC transporter ATP-binding protein [Caballeronia concitans]|uniref:ABC transporter-like protein n=1 Tax=Caballeronia concitans TaxID=1777133 RepID=A0A658QTN6_9BURK|nr:ABC transporter ATP-binding protein [Caballeronia concitans]KIG01936.1 Taurine-transporting ATPase [Burkholderia sp. MR1]SAL20523.1 ABC transporter-like protein [Caballeronia concitans]
MKGSNATAASTFSEPLRVRQLSHGFESPDGSAVTIFDRLDFSVGHGEIVSIVGRSGAGKSTLFNLISGLLTPQSGVISVGQRADGEAGRIAYMLQKDLMMPWRTVLQNALLGIELYRKVQPDDVASARQMLARYGLGAVADAYPHSLSGGMRQRVALTRTLLVDPTLVLLDEPFSALDYETRLALEDDIIALSARSGTSVVLVTHDIEEAIAMSDRVILLGGRPARIEDQIEIELTTHGPRTAVSAREAPEFRGYHARIWNGLRGQPTSRSAEAAQSSIPAGAVHD